MLEVMHGTKEFDRIIWREIDAGRSVALRASGRGKKQVHQLLAIYADFDEAERTGEKRVGLLFRLGIRAMFSPTLFGLLNHARLRGMRIVARDEGSTLVVVFSRSELK